MIWCFRHHPAFWSWKSELGPQRHGFGQWVMCGLAQPSAEGWRDLALALGVLSADEDGGLLRWQWPWRRAPFRREFVRKLVDRLWDGV